MLNEDDYAKIYWYDYIWLLIPVLGVVIFTMVLVGRCILEEPEDEEMP